MIATSVRLAVPVVVPRSAAVSAFGADAGVTPVLSCTSAKLILLAAEAVTGSAKSATESGVVPTARSSTCTDTSSSGWVAACSVAPARR